MPRRLFYAAYAMLRHLRVCCHTVACAPRLPLLLPPLSLLSRVLRHVNACSGLLRYAQRLYTALSLPSFCRHAELMIFSSSFISHCLIFSSLII